MFSVSFLANYTKTKELRKFFEKHGFITNLINPITHDPVEDDQESLHINLLANYIYNSDEKLPSQEVFKTALEHPGIVQIEIYVNKNNGK